MACSRCALRTSGFWLRLAMMSPRVAPVMARWNLVVRLVRFFDTSSCRPFLCLRRYSTVQLILRGFRFIACDFSHFAVTNMNGCKTRKVLCYRRFRSNKRKNSMFDRIKFQDISDVAYRVFPRNNMVWAHVTEI